MVPRLKYKITAITTDNFDPPPGYSLVKVFVIPLGAGSHPIRALWVKDFRPPEVGWTAGKLPA